MSDAAARVQLDPDNARSLASMLEVLDPYMPRNALRLGGGTALAALWRHRLSTDIDLVCDRAIFTQVWDAPARRELRETLRVRQREGKVSRVSLSARMLGWRTPTGLVSVVSSSIDNFPRRFADEQIADTGVRLATVDAIIYGKVFGRLLARGQAPARDGYDIAVAMLKRRPMVDRLLEEYATEAELLGEALGENAGTRHGRPLLRATFPEIAADPWREAERIYSDRLTLADYREVPADSQGDSSPHSHGSDLGR